MPTTAAVPTPVEELVEHARDDLEAVEQAVARAEVDGTPTADLYRFQGEARTALCRALASHRAEVSVAVDQECAAIVEGSWTRFRPVAVPAPVEESAQ